MKTSSETAPTPKVLSVEDVQRCTELLEAIVNDRTVIAEVPEEVRIKLLVAAGRASRPLRFEAEKMSRAIRRNRRLRDEAADRQVRASAQIRVARQAAVFTAPAMQLDGFLPPSEERELLKARACYVCKADFKKLHFFYDSMCPDCAAYNYAKRHQSARLDGRTALITGARLKIGYQASLMMLRAGAKVIATTRFPHDAAVRYSREPDFSSWSDRLQVHGLDLRHSPSVEIFARFIDQTCDRLDILVNNAAQTVRRPPAFYAHLLELEAKPFTQLPPQAQALLREREALKAALAGAPAHARPELADATGLTAWHAGGSGIGLREPAQLSQLKYSYDDAERGLDIFPEGKTDADLQQVDLRAQNSWRLTLAEVSTPEMLELQLINSVAPFILCSKLKPLMLRDVTGEKHIVNVSAMEGSFSRHTKTDKHPHTNMAKAALNMMTLTSAPDYAKSGIFMNAVDTGWVTDEDPALHATRKKDDLDFQPPLDIVDGAARVCDPFFSGLLTGNHLWGKFLKDYKPTDW